MKRELIPYFLEIQDLQLKNKELERNLKNLQVEYESFRGENLGIIQKKEEELKNITDSLKKLKDQQKEKEDQIILLKEKLNNEEKRILVLKNPKEVIHVEKEIESLKRLVAKLEDELLNLMLEIEEKEKLEREVKNSFKEFKEGFERKVKEYEEKINSIKNEMENLNSEIELRRNNIPNTDLEEFDKLSKQKNYRAIARIINKDICDGCRMSIPKIVLERLKKEEIVNCPNCGRILWVE